MSHYSHCKKKTKKNHPCNLNVLTFSLNFLPFVYFVPRNTEWLGLEESSGGHLGQALAKADSASLYTTEK